MESEPDILQLQQFKLINAQILTNGISSQLINTEFMLALQQSIVSKYDKWEIEIKESLQSYVKGLELNYNNKRSLLKLCMYVNFYDIPYNIKTNYDNTLSFLLNLIHLPCKTIEKVQAILN